MIPAPTALYPARVPSAGGVERQRVEALVRELLLALGEDPDRDGLKRAPERVAQNWAELLSGVGHDPATALDGVIAVRSSEADTPAAQRPL